jgi:hypothetical protein
MAGSKISNRAPPWARFDAEISPHLLENATVDAQARAVLLRRPFVVTKA